MLRAEVAENNARFAAALAHADAVEACSVYAEGATLLPPGGEAISGRAAIEGFWRGGIEVGVRSLHLETLVLEEAGGLGYEIGRYRLLLAANGVGARSDVGKYVVVHKRQRDGSWKRAVDIFNSDVPYEASPARPDHRGASARRKEDGCGDRS